MKLLRLSSARSCAVLFVSILFCFSAFSQISDTHPSHPDHERCTTVKMDSIRHAQNPDLQSNEEFEEWIEKIIAEKKKFQSQGLIINGVYQIPIVVHVLHDGEPIGTGRNLSVAAIQSQIDVMNEDFRRIFGTNGYNTHPDGADTEIEFCLARRRPDGSAFPAGEDGINRVDAGAQFGGGPTYGTAAIDGTIKPWFTATQFGGWDPGTYMNFWSIDLQGGLLGYAQFPTTVLGGMGCNAQNITTDGVVMDYATIGKSAVTGFPGPFNEGRTATHEVGHWLGLRHIWGDGGCGVDDFCLDTPESDASNGGCPTGHVSCGSVDMIENYMDYTNDLCMNIFTNDQKMRMRTVLENSPIRASLINSDACVPPAVSDASIVGITSPDGDNCAGLITPNVVLRNRGSSNLTSVTIAYTLNNGTATTFGWTGNIAPGAENNVVLPGFTAPLGVHDFRAYTELPNGVIDPDPTYDTSLIAFAVSNGIMPDYSQDFETGIFPPDVRWSVDNPNGDCYEWVGQACVSSTGVANNVAAQMTNYNNGTNQDEYLYTPFFILPCNASAANVSFDKAYRRRIAGSNDRLRLEMSDDCGATWSTVLFDQSGGTLDGPNGTANGYWIPTTAGEWQNVNVDLMPYVTGTSQSVQFRFRATNDGNGGNLYVDNFDFTATTPGEIEVTAAGLDVLDGGFYDFGAGPVGGTVTTVFTITNTGTSNLTLTGPISVTGDAEFALNTTFGTTTVAPGGTTTFSIDFTASGAGPFTGNVSFGSNDCDEGTYNFELNGTGDVVPPTAGFTVSPNAICEGQAVTFTSTSTGASSYAWTFTGGTPATATGVGPHVVTYATAGAYNASLTVTNPFGSDTDTQTNAVLVAPGTGATLPVAEGFDSGTFAPLGWLVGNGGNQAVTWVQDPNNNGNAPTANNSASIDFFNTNTTGDQDSLFVIPADLTGLVSAQMTFDKAYARYNGTYNDRMQVIVSTDCGATWSVELDQAGTALATDPDQTGAYTAPATWVNETIDLTAYIGQSNVRIGFVGISGWGQFLYIDNVNLTGVVSACTDPDVPTLTATPSAICDGATADITITGNLNDATDWEVYTGSCGGTSVGSTNTGSITVTPTGPSTTYFIRGEGGCVVPGSCASVSITVNSATAGSETVSACDTYTWSANATTYTASGTYTATLTNAAGCDSTATLNLTINNSTSGSESITACDSYTWSANATTYTASGTYTATLTNAAGCDSTATLNLTINNSSSGSESVTACDSYTWSANTTTYTASGTYTATLTNAAGCDSTATLNLIINNSSSGSESVTACDSYTWSANTTTYTASGTYTATLTNAAGCDSTATLNLTINNSTSGSESVTACDSYTWSANTTTYTASGTYTATLTNAAGCDSTATLNLTINNSTSGSESVTSCGSYTWSANATTYTASGTYTATLTGSNGCDSVATLNLSIQSFTTGTDVISACAPVTWIDGITYTSSNNTATFTLVGGSVNGCDSIVSLDLTIGTPNTGSETATSCGPYFWAASGVTYASSGNFTTTLTNASGCDSVVTLSLTVNSPTSGSESVTACDSYTWSANTTTYTASGTYTATLTNAAGCDSTATLNLTINNSTSGSESVTACDSYTWSANTTTYTASGTYTATLTNVAGCDSTATLNLTINNSSSGSESVTACDSYTWSANTTTYTASGTYTATLTNAAGCDSTATLNLTINNSSSGSESVTACGSYTWSANTTTYTASGTYTATLTNAAGCDSTATLNLTINNATSGSENVTACGSYTWSANATTYSASGTYTTTLTGSNGCDSVATLNLSIQSFTTGTDVISACAPVTWIDGITYASSNNTATFTLVGGSVNGCDSIVSLDLTIGTPNTGSETATSCGPYFWAASGVTYASSGNFTTTLTNASGCDSVVTLSLTVNSPTSGSESVTSCGSYLWTANGTTYASSGTFTTTLTGSNGCDSTATLNLTVNSPTFGSESVTACDSYTWSANATAYTASGSYTATLTGINGCDSTATLNLTINNSTSGSESVTACDSYTWSANTTTYTASGTYTATLTNAAGCDSTATLNLTINNATSGSETVAACNAYTWTTNGTTYTSSGSYTTILTNANGCDSTVTLNLTINTPTSGSENVTACGSYTWSANGQTYTTAGTYTAVLTGSNGCDSTATLNLTFGSAVTGTDVITACDTYTWIDGVTYTSSNNTATFTIIGGAVTGCDSTVTLDLTMNYATTGSETAAACDFYTWPANGVTYTTSGTYTAVLTNALGCDSIVTLDVSINTPTTGTETVTVCDSYVWSADGNTYTTTGAYTAILTNAAGCDSIVTLDLTVQGLPSVSLALTTPTFCETDVDVSLAGGSPAGGTYTGTGVTAGVFSPSAAGSGVHVITYEYTDANGCTASTVDSITVKDCSGIDEITGTVVSIYPNPTTGVVTLASNGAVLDEVRVFDNSGKLIDVIVLNGVVEEVDISDYARGVYQFQIKAGEYARWERIVKN